MPETKTYMIVTNDRYERPLQHDLVGAEAVAEYLGMSVSGVRKCLMTGKWSHLRTKKAVAVGVKVAEDPYIVQKRWELEHDRSDYFRQRYRKKQNENTKQTQEV